ncbi:hypothetical protein DI272_15380 [Streptomyces sp. Act143]|uniref:hypothetical protein n=1 Tax=Streptomyces sp. Act143 TaxID=2200760 RepID=UPI000D67AE45|nr:hypothetical protein [Streptomyces sp. Act143]PWI20485.1 hypothetical protein DI272_15380 [Streptomyces sp. Act143]
MYEYELSQLRSDDLLRQARHQRLVREAIQGRRAARREAARREAESEVHTGRPRRYRFLRAA